jgi:hypothetical protein
MATATQGEMTVGVREYLDNLGDLLCCTRLNDTPWSQGRIGGPVRRSTVFVGVRPGEKKQVLQTGGGEQSALSHVVDIEHDRYFARGTFDEDDYREATPPTIWVLLSAGVLM